MNRKSVVVCIGVTRTDPSDLMTTEQALEGRPISRNK